MADYTITLSPNAPYVTVGATTHFVLRPTNFAIEVIDQTEDVLWMALRVEENWTPPQGDAPASVMYDSEVIGPTEGTVSWSITWPTEGTWHIVGTVKRTHEIYSAIMEVVPKDKVIARSDVWPKTHADPHAVSDWGGKTLASMLSLAEQRISDGSMTDALYRRHAGQMRDLAQYLHGLDRLLSGVSEKDLSYIRGTWVADIVDDPSQDVVQVQAILYEIKSPAPGPRWRIIDWTNPTCERGMAIHDGHAMEHAASIQLAIEHWAANSQYPSGTLKIEVDGWAGYWLVRARNDGTARELTLRTIENPMAKLADVLGAVSIAAFVLGILAAVTGIGAAATPALFAISAATGAGSGAAHMIYLVNVGSDNWRTYTLDALSIAGNLFGLRGTAFKMFGTAPINVGMAEGTKFVLWAELGTTSAEIIFVTESAHNRIQEIRNDPSLTPREQLEEATKEAAAAIAATGLLVWSAKQTQDELARLKVFLESADKRPPGWVGHADETAVEHREAILHNKTYPPDQSLLYRDSRSLRVAAKYAEENTSPRVKPADAFDEPPDGWTPGTRWNMMKKLSRRRATISGALELPDGRFVPGRSDQPTGEKRASKQAANKNVDSEEFYSHIRSPELREALVAIGEPRGNGHGSCAEVFAIDDAIELVGAEGLQGSFWDARFTRFHSSDPVNARAIPACRTCQHLFDKFGIMDDNALRRGVEERVKKEAVKGFLARVGFPRYWSRANEVIAQLKQSGFPVSPAAQEIIRRYGGMNTYRDGAPGSCVLFEIDPASVLMEGADYVEHVHGVRDLCPIGYDYEGLGVMCIAPDNTVYFQGGPYFKGVTVDEVIEKLLTGERDGGSIPPDEEPL